MANETANMRTLADKAVKAGISKDQFVSRFIGKTAALAAREYELRTLGQDSTQELGRDAALISLHPLPSLDRLCTFSGQLDSL